MSPNQPQDQIERIDRIQNAIATLEKQKELLFAQGEVAPIGTVVSRYQVRQGCAQKQLVISQVRSPSLR